MITPVFASVLILFAFFIGALVGRHERRDRRKTHQPPIDMTPSLAQLRAWRSDRR